MIITRDESKPERNLASRGLDFADLTMEFFVGSVVVPAKHGRFMAIGPFAGLTHAVIFQALGSEAIAIISMRRATRKERAVYEQS